MTKNQEAMLKKLSELLECEFKQVDDGFYVVNDGEKHTIFDPKILKLAIAMAENKNRLLKKIDEASAHDLVTAWTLLAESCCLRAVQDIHTKIVSRLLFALSLRDALYLPCFPHADERHEASRLYHEDSLSCSINVVKKLAEYAGQCR